MQKSIENEKTDQKFGKRSALSESETKSVIIIYYVVVVLSSTLANFFL